MTRTGRTPRQVMDDALGGAAAAGWNDKMGADADHLKTPQDVESTAEAGFVFFTIDPSDHVDVSKAPGDEARWISSYRGKKVTLASGTSFVIDDQVCARAAAKYGRAVNHAIALARHIEMVAKRHQRDYEIELSVDETPQPTTLAEHFIIADRCLREGMKLVSLAPRFIGDFEKGVDYKGDLAAFEKSLADHAAIAQMLGPYKLSLHSGSDKLSIYPAFARATKGRFHVKTAGTSYLEALRVVARHDPSLLRRIIDFARDRYDKDRATYHVSATLTSVPPPSQLDSDEKIEQVYLERWTDVRGMRGFIAPGRQILHCTYGSVLMDPQLRPALMEVLKEHQNTYDQILAEHFGRHLAALRQGM
jgi:hypothetical protein